jgi:hypothetical protein
VFKISKPNKKPRFEKKVLAELTGEDKIKAESFEIAARTIFYHAERCDGDDSLCGQISALGVVLDKLAKLSIPRAIAFVDQAYRESDEAYTRSWLDRRQRKYEGEPGFF